MPELEARLRLRPMETKVREYLSALDSALDTLSHGREGLLSAVPDWCFSHREIRLGVNRDGQGVALRFVPRGDLTEDQFFFEELETTGQLNAFIEPWSANFHPAHLSHAPFTMLGPFKLSVVGDPLASPRASDRGMTGWGAFSKAEEMLTAESGRNDAMEFWNNAVSGLPAGPSFVDQALGVFNRLRASIRLRAFREKRIHRLLRDHAKLLLPPFKRMFFEHAFYLETDLRRADFVLQRELGLPPLLIELESPVHRVFRKNGQVTDEVTHAKKQVAEWVWFIERDPQRNAEGEMSFLAGPKQRLVVIGAGLEFREALLQESATTDTSVWTYDLLLEQAKEQWNGILEEQCRQIGRPVFRPF